MAFRPVGDPRASTSLQPSISPSRQLLKRKLPDDPAGREQALASVDHSQGLEKGYESSEGGAPRVPGVESGPPPRTPDPPSWTAQLNDLLQHPHLPRYLRRIYSELQANTRHELRELGADGGGAVELYMELAGGVFSVLERLNDPQHAKDHPRLQSELRAAMVGARQLCVNSFKLNPRIISGGTLDVVNHNSQYPWESVVARNWGWLDAAKLSPQQAGEIASATAAYCVKMSILETERRALALELMSVVQCEGPSMMQQALRSARFRALAQRQERLLAAEHATVWVAVWPITIAGVLTMEQHARLIATDSTSVLPDLLLLGRLVLDAVQGPPAAMSPPVAQPSLARTHGAQWSAQGTDTAAPRPAPTTAAAYVGSASKAPPAAPAALVAGNQAQPAGHKKEQPQALEEELAPHTAVGSPGPRAGLLPFLVGLGRSPKPAVRSQPVSQPSPRLPAPALSRAPVPEAEALDVGFHPFTQGPSQRSFSSVLQTVHQAQGWRHAQPQTF